MITLFIPDPNPHPSSGAESETFVDRNHTTVIPIPTASQILTLPDATVTLQAGGTPVGGPLPNGVEMPGAVTPTWSTYHLPFTNTSSIIKFSCAHTRWKSPPASFCEKYNLHRSTLLYHSGRRPNCFRHPSKDRPRTSQRRGRAVGRAIWRSDSRSHAT
jgi:hypothetical protein